MVGTRGRISSFVGVVAVDMSLLSLGIDAVGPEEKFVVSAGESAAVTRVVGSDDSAAGVAGAGMSLSTKEESCRRRTWLKWSMW